MGSSARAACGRGAGAWQHVAACGLVASRSAASHESSATLEFCLLPRLGCSSLLEWVCWRSAPECQHGCRDGDLQAQAEDLALVENAGYWQSLCRSLLAELGDSRYGGILWPSRDTCNPAECHIFSKHWGFLWLITTKLWAMGKFVITGDEQAPASFPSSPARDVGLSRLCCSS